jgi:hypothetical protein
MDETTMQYMTFRYFSSPVETKGFPLLILLCQNGVAKGSREVYEALNWRGWVDPGHVPYLESLSKSLRSGDEDSEILFAELENMSAGPIRLIDKGRISAQDLPDLISGFF